MVARGRFELPSTGLFLTCPKPVIGRVSTPLLVHYTTGLQRGFQLLRPISLPSPCGLEGRDWNLQPHDLDVGDTGNKDYCLRMYDTLVNSRVDDVPAYEVQNFSPIHENQRLSQSQQRGSVKS